MTKTEFENTPVSASTLVCIGDDKYPIFSVDYQSGLIELKDTTGTLTIPYKFCTFETPVIKWDGLTYYQKEELRKKRPELWRKLYREKFGSEP